jgi:NADH dehydrogenase (ubiquinone) 1 alpha subcomplex subunit 6
MWSADLRQTDVQLLKWRQDYQETMNCWKQVDHVMGILLENPGARPRRTFLEKFYEGACSLACLGEWLGFVRLTDILPLTGRDEDASRPAATGV